MVRSTAPRIAVRWRNMSHASQGPPLPDTEDMRRSYVRVIVSWLVVLAALYAFQEYFS